MPVRTIPTASFPENKSKLSSRGSPRKVTQCSCHIRIKVKKRRDFRPKDMMKRPLTFPTTTEASFTRMRVKAKMTAKKRQTKNKPYPKAKGQKPTNIRLTNVSTKIGFFLPKCRHLLNNHTSSNTHESKAHLRPSTSV